MFHFSPTPSTSGFSQMARMMDSLILDNLAPIAFTKITTRCPAHNVKKATSSGSIPNNAGAAAVGLMRSGGLAKPAKIPTQGEFLMYKTVCLRVFSVSVGFSIFFNPLR